VNNVKVLKNWFDKFFKVKKIGTRLVKSNEDIIVDFLKKNIFNNVTNEDMDNLYREMWD